MNKMPGLLRDAIDAFASLPGIGKKTALRLVLHILRQEEHQVLKFSEAIRKFRLDIRYCQRCHNLSDDPVCPICSDLRRQDHVLCVVESIRDVIAIEETHQYNGRYHVLGGIINPLEGVGPNDLNIQSLLDRISAEKIQEVIMAISPTIEGDTTIYYLSKVLQPYNLKLTTIARGIAFGGELEYADEITLGRSIMARLPYSTKEGN